MRRRFHTLSLFALVRVFSHTQRMPSGRSGEQQQKNTTKNFMKPWEEQFIRAMWIVASPLRLCCLCHHPLPPGPLHVRVVDGKMRAAGLDPETTPMEE